MKNPILEKHFSNIRDQLKLVLNTEKNHDSINQIQLLYNDVFLIRTMDALLPMRILHIV